MKSFIPFNVSSSGGGFINNFLYKSNSKKLTRTVQTYYYVGIMNSVQLKIYEKFWECSVKATTLL